MEAVAYFNREVASFHAAYRQSRDFRARFDLWTRLIAHYADTLDARTCLDLGCGPGLFSLYAAELGLETIGIDPSPAMLQKCTEQQQRRGLANVRFLPGALPLTTRLPAADLILCSSVLEYVQDWETAVRGIVDLLTPGGVFLVSLPNGESWYRHYERWKYRLTGQPEYYCHVQHVLPFAEARTRFQSFGLTCLEHHYYADEPLVARLAGRVRGERFSKNLYVCALQKQSGVSRLAA